MGLGGSLCKSVSLCAFLCLSQYMPAHRCGYTAQDFLTRDPRELLQKVSSMSVGVPGIGSELGSKKCYWLLIEVSRGYF